MYSIKFLGFPIVTIIFAIIFVLLIIRYWKSIEKQFSVWRILLISIRSILLIGFLLLLIDPLLHLIKSEIEYPEVGIFYDVSHSMKHHLDEDKLNYSSIKQKMSKWIDDNNLQAKSFYLGENIRLIQPGLEDIVDDQHTDFTELPNFISLHNTNINFLFTDGISTAGIDFNTIEFEEQRPVYSIGFGNLYAENDISIAKVEYPLSVIKGDSVAMTVSIKTSTTEELPVQLILVNNEEEIVHSEKKTIQKGNSFVDVSMDIVSDKLSELMTFKVISDLQENDTKNNNWAFNLNIVSGKNQILLLSGALSQNTSYIKDILQNLPRTEITHVFRKNLGNWSSNLKNLFLHSYELVVLDDYPNNYLDNSQFSEVLVNAEQNGIPVFYLEGPNSNTQSSALISSYFGISAIRQKKSVLLSLEIGSLPQNLLSSYTSIEMLPPQNNINIWSNKHKNGYEILKYSDGSLAIYQTRQKSHIVTGVFMPELSKTHFKLRTTEQDQKLSEICKDLFLSVLISEDKYMNLQTDKQVYYFGDPVVINVSVNPYLSKKPKEIDLLVKSETEEMRIPLQYVDEINAYNCEFIPENSGNLQIYAETKWKNGQTSNSKPQTIIIQDLHTEFKKLLQNKIGLKRVADNTGGLYNNIFELDSLLNYLEITPLEKRNSYLLSSLSFFRYWWIFIVLLTIEWIIRKKIGLL